MYREEEKRISKLLVSEQKRGGFSCCNCGRWVPFCEFMGTEHRNHCVLCLWSKHVDLKKPGDRRSVCKFKMRPIGLTFKQEGADKYGVVRQGELMLVHECVSCGKVSINRIAADDNPEAILRVFEESKLLAPQKVGQLRQDGIRILSEENKGEVITQLFGKKTGGK